MKTLPEVIEMSYAQNIPLGSVISHAVRVANCIEKQSGAKMTGIALVGSLFRSLKGIDGFGPDSDIDIELYFDREPRGVGYVSCFPKADWIGNNWIHYMIRTGIPCSSPVRDVLLYNVPRRVLGQAPECQRIHSIIMAKLEPIVRLYYPHWRGCLIYLTNYSVRGLFPPEFKGEHSDMVAVLTEIVIGFPYDDEPNYLHVEVPSRLSRADRNVALLQSICEVKNIHRHPDWHCDHIHAKCPIGNLPALVGVLDQIAWDLPPNEEQLTAEQYREVLKVLMLVVP